MKKNSRRLLFVAGLSYLWLTTGLYATEPETTPAPAQTPSPPPAPPPAPSVPPAPPPVPSAPPAPPPAKGPDYHHDEAGNQPAAGKCVKDLDCDGARSCAKSPHDATGICVGIARH